MKRTCTKSNWHQFIFSLLVNWLCDVENGYLGPRVLIFVGITEVITSIDDNFCYSIQDLLVIQK